MFIRIFADDFLAAVVNAVKPDENFKVKIRFCARILSKARFMYCRWLQNVTSTDSLTIVAPFSIQRKDTKKTARRQTNFSFITKKSFVTNLQSRLTKNAFRHILTVRLNYFC